MKKAITLFGIIMCSLLYSQQVPKVLKSVFSKEALAQKITAENGTVLTIKEVFNKHKGKVVVLDLWAGWCRDCIIALPKAEELEKNNPDVDFIFFSLDRNREGFDKSLEKYNMKGKENYWFSEGWKNNFNNYIDLNWIPRYLVIDQKAKIAKYYAIAPDDPEIQATINKLLKK
ncbi:alkyl hydroperoxide reductase [Elizabethkingia meningoseptica]|uniref:Alkyl hydroperoxide reductase n=1 Tax=Elizabethkingia meningoseptica TaxID=238 RepID=A0A1V3U2B0_ELIME|nr:MULTISPECIES: thioredoxin family protein [Elizabethkingia]AQX13828.1 alkyl hydroperoxide reductase [Elizabethkingia meningoseptica]MBG0515632.1 thioredoxin family protein [Elizabethkingia meningoseptica]MDE5434001.1 thioredoxin family protein [Elizabethkingia meningoseptica]MDE5449607.1 thioredoxin family protein [Elizabethkingia meningoseptica]MDE5470277.1 thioredoxin family protein [Elizabethkingia meningoseptica]